MPSPYRADSGAILRPGRKQGQSLSTQGASVHDVPDGAVDREMFRSFLVVYQEKNGAESVYLRFAWDPTILRGGNLSLRFTSSGEPGLSVDLCQGGVCLDESTVERSRQR